MPQNIRNILRYEFITITDVPAGGPGIYNFGPGDGQAQRDYQNACAGIMHAQNSRSFWDRLARSVNLNRVARCHGATAYAARQLQSYAGANGLRLLICGVVDRDHHLLVVTDDAGVNAGGTVHAHAINNAIIADLWQYNLTRQLTGGIALAQLADTVANHLYTAGNPQLRIYVDF